MLEDAESCRRKMNNATALIQGLGGEKVRWTEASKRFQDQINRLVKMLQMYGNSQFKLYVYVLMLMCVSSGIQV